MRDRGVFSRAAAGRSVSHGASSHLPRLLKAPPTLARACHEAWVRHGMSPDAVEACIAHNPHKPGIAKLRVRTRRGRRAQRARAGIPRAAAGPRPPATAHEHRPPRRQGRLPLAAARPHGRAAVVPLSCDPPCVRAGRGAAQALQPRRLHLGRRVRAPRTHGRGLGAAPGWSRERCRLSAWHRVRRREIKAPSSPAIVRGSNPLEPFSRTVVWRLSERSSWLSVPARGGQCDSTDPSRRCAQARRAPLRRQTIRGMIRIATMLATLIIGLIAGPEVSL
jgi:hypothetical protein